jgi:hypothetical protein
MGEGMTTPTPEPPRPVPSAEEQEKQRKIDEAAQALIRDEGKQPKPVAP